MTFLLAAAIGFIAGLRSMTAPAIVAWATSFGWLSLEGTPLAFLGSPAARFILLALMIGELVLDKLPFTPSRTRPGPFGGRIVSGALSGAALMAGFGGYRARTGLVRTFGVPDYVVALLEDVVAVGGALLIVAGGA
jgi:uncharacterized membrane protein